MSVEASIDIKLNSYLEYETINVIKALIDGGWGVKDKNDKVWYLPVGDKDDFEWEKNVLTEEEIRRIVQEKEKLNETIGIILYWKDTEVGISVLAYSANEFSVGLNINRKKLSQYDNRAITDVNWYIQNIIQVLKEQQYQIESFVFEESQ